MEEIKKLLETQRDMLGNISNTVVALSDAQKNLDTRLKDIEDRTAPRRVIPRMPGLEDEAKSFSITRAINAIVTGDWSNAGFEKEVFDQTRKRAASTNDDSNLGYFVPNEVLPGFIEMLTAESVVTQMGATVLSNLSGVPVEIPKQVGGATAYWVEENASITESDLSAGQLALTPKAVAAMVKMSNRLLRLSNPSVEAMVRSDIARVIALASDLAALRGSGVAGQPIGIANTANINTVEIGANGGAPNFDHLYDMQYELQKDNAYRGNLGYIFHPATRRRLVKTKVAQFSTDTSGEYIVQPMVSEQALVSWMGHPYKMTTQIPINLTKGSAVNCTEIYFANWSELIIGQWGGLEIMASRETSDAFAKNQTWVRIIQDIDIAVRHPESFCLINDATIA
jgi:HK97 family phage major capsid protein